MLQNTQNKFSSYGKKKGPMSIKWGGWYCREWILFQSLVSSVSKSLPEALSLKVSSNQVTDVKSQNNSHFPSKVALNYDRGKSVLIFSSHFLFQNSEVPSLSLAWDLKNISLAPFNSVSFILCAASRILLVILII